MEINTPCNPFQLQGYIMCFVATLLPKGQHIYDSIEMNGQSYGYCVL